MIKKLYTALIFTHIITHANILLEQPRVVSPEEMEQHIANWETCFQWKASYGCNFICIYLNGSAGILAQALCIPIRSYNFPYYAAIKKLLSHQEEYYFAQPLVLKDQNPQQLIIEELCDLLQHNRFIFYTGAGVSSAANVATMHDLEQSLKLDSGITDFLKELFFNPQSMTAAFKEFCESAIKAEPTNAHLALHQIAQCKRCAIVTENVDLLQQRTGSYPLFTHGPDMRLLKPEDLKEVDIIVCIGLSGDDCGFLAYYKKIHPEGLIVAINKEKPNYLMHNDYLVQGDVQTVLIQMAALLI